MHDVALAHRHTGISQAAASTMLMLAILLVLLLAVRPGRWQCGATSPCLVVLAIGALVTCFFIGIVAVPAGIGVARCLCRSSALLSFHLDFVRVRLAGGAASACGRAVAARAWPAAPGLPLALLAA